MGWFGKRQGMTSAEAAELRTQLGELSKAFRTLRDEVHEDMERAYRHRKAAEAAARRDAKAEAEGVRPADGPGHAAAPPLTATWGARRRRIMRALRPQTNGDGESEA